MVAGAYFGGIRAAVADKSDLSVAACTGNESDLTQCFGRQLDTRFDALKGEDMKQKLKAYARRKLLLVCSHEPSVATWAVGDYHIEPA